MSAEDGRTVWYPEDAGWLSWERVVILGEEFGPAAISVLSKLKCDAKLQNAGWRVKAGWRSLARAAFVDDVQLVHQVVERAAELGVLDDLEHDEFNFVCKVSGMAASERKARAAGRQQAARDRAQQPPVQAEVTERDAALRDVTTGDEPSPTGEDRTGEDRATPDGVAHQASDPQGGRARSRTADTSVLPDDLPQQLHEIATAIHGRLTDVWQERGGNEPTLRGVGLALRRFPDRDHASVTSELEHWALAGRGAHRSVKDWTATLAQFLQRTPAGAPSRTAITTPARVTSFDPSKPLDDFALAAYRRAGVDLPAGATQGDAVAATEGAAA